MRHNADTQVVGFDLDSDGHVTAKITVMRALPGYVHPVEPSARDLPGDIRLALREWLDKAERVLE